MITEHTPLRIELEDKTIDYIETCQYDPRGFASLKLVMTDGTAVYLTTEHHNGGSFLTVEKYA